MTSNGHRGYVDTYIAKLTLYAFIGDFEVGFEVIVTRSCVGKIFVEDPDATLPPPGTIAIHYFEHVVGTAEVAEVLRRTLVYPHPTVVRMRQHYDVIQIRATCAEIVRLAYFVEVYNCKSI